MNPTKNGDKKKGDIGQQAARNNMIRVPNRCSMGYYPRMRGRLQLA